MISFSILCVQFLAVDRNGKKSQGKLFASSLQDAKVQLFNLGLTPRRLKSRKWRDNPFYSSSLTQSELSHFTKQLATLLTSSVALDQALKIMQRGTHFDKTKIVICKLLQAISYGLPLSQSLRVCDHRFDGFYASLVETAEQHGDLASCFTELAALLDKNQYLKQRVSKMLIYPTLVCLVALGVSYLMLTRVIPEFESMFQGLGSALPAFTQKVLSLSDWVQLHALTSLFCTFVLASIIAALYRKNSAIKYLLDGLVLKIPVIGGAIQHLAQCRFCQTLAITLASGMPITQCLQSAKVTCTNRYIERKILHASTHLEAGNSLAHALSMAQLLDTTHIQLVAIGEHSGQLETMLNHASDQLTSRVDNQVEHIGQLIEPIMIVVLGTLVGSLVIAMYLPIFQLMDHFG
jgi:type IV pilus assembly protein PilC